MKSITYIDRKSRKQEVEKVYKLKGLQFLYGDSIVSRFLGRPLLSLLFRYPFFSMIYGYLQKQKRSKKKIEPFIQNYQIDSSEFLENVSTFQSFNDFFIRKLKEKCRPIASGDDVAIIPADGRYRFYGNIQKADGFMIKGQKFTLTSLLKDSALAAQYEEGSMVIARLCPTDYHRFHFPCNCIPQETHIINGWLYSVNPIAIKHNIQIFSENKRSYCVLNSQTFGKVLFIEVGATCVGTIHQTYESERFYPKGAEKGFFCFGGSSLIMLFQPNRILFDRDLLELSQTGLEIKCLMGQSLGRAQCALP